MRSEREKKEKERERERERERRERERERERERSGVEQEGTCLSDLRLSACQISIWCIKNL